MNLRKNYIRKLEIEWKTIRDEGLALMDDNQNFPNFDKEAEGLQKKGDWRQFNLWQRGMEEEANCKLVPKTCHMIRAMTEATGCRRGQIKYRSVILWQRNSLFFIISVKTLHF